MLVLCLDLEKIIFIDLYSVILKQMIQLIFKITVLYKFSGYQTRILHSKYLILIVLCLVLTNSLFSIIVTWRFKGKIFR